MKRQQHCSHVLSRAALAVLLTSTWVTACSGNQDSPSSGTGGASPSGRRYGVSAAINGVSNGAALAVLTYIGFDSISTLSEEAHNPRRNILLATVLVVTADNLWLFLIGWELMALTSFCLIAFEHEREEARNAGVLFLIMSHAGSAMILAAFLLLVAFSGSTDFAGFHLLAS